jgi:hypothetical protein
MTDLTPREPQTIGVRIRESLRTFRGAIEKKFERVKLLQAPRMSQLDLSMVPNYVTYKAALVREKMLLQHVCFALGCLLVGHFIISRVEVSHLNDRLRTKEFILAPGVADFIPAAPQTVPDSYVSYAVMDYISTLGNTNAQNIEEQYRNLSSSMSEALKIQFAAEAREWIEKAKSENVSEMITVVDKRIESDDHGRYKVLAHTKTETFVGTEHIGYRNEVIEMEMRLIPPSIGRRWYLEISQLNRTGAEAFSAEQKLHGEAIHE